MRVIHIIPGLPPHGAETVLFRLATNSRHVAHEIVCLGGRDYYSRLLEEHEIPVHHLELKSATAQFAAIPKLARLVRNSGADVVQCWMQRANLVGGIAGRLAGVPVVWNIRWSSLKPLRARQRLLVYAGGPLTRLIPVAVINCSASSAELHARWGYGFVDNVLIPNGYDPEVFRPDDAARQRVRKGLGIEDEEFVVGTIARWHPQKGIPVLVRAIELLRDRGIKVCALLIGRGLDAANVDLATLLRQSGCAETVQLLGGRSDIPELAAALDLHVLPSVGSEGFPNVVAETMLSGTPNVATDVGDSRLIVGEAGWIVPPRDAPALADAIAQANDEHASVSKAWARRRNSARERIAKKFSLERMVQNYEELWQRIVRQSSRDS